MQHKMIAVLAVMAASSAAWADDANSTLDNYLSTEITRINQAFNEASAEQSVLPQEGAESVELRQLFLTIGPKASFGLSSVLDVEISPEVTFVWEKTED